MTIEEIQMLSKCLLVAAGVLTVVAVILFIRFDIRNIWGLIVRHSGRNTYVQALQKSEPIQIEEKRQTLPLEKREVESAEQETMLLELDKYSIHIFQDITYIHTDIKII